MKFLTVIYFFSFLVASNAMAATSTPDAAEKQEALEELVLSSEEIKQQLKLISKQREHDECIVWRGKTNQKEDSFVTHVQYSEGFSLVDGFTASFTCLSYTEEDGKEITTRATSVEIKGFFMGRKNQKTYISNVSMTNI